MRAVIIIIIHPLSCSHFTEIVVSLSYPRSVYLMWSSSIFALMNYDRTAIFEFRTNEINQINETEFSSSLLLFLILVFKVGIIREKNNQFNLLGSTTLVYNWQPPPEKNSMTMGFSITNFSSHLTLILYCVIHCGIWCM